jgi:Domain of unknown function (DUF4157)
MNEQTAIQAMVKPTFTPIASGFLQRACACGQHTGGGGECEECKKKHEGTLQLAATNTSAVSEVPAIVHEVLRSSGKPLDAATRAFMEPRFGHDFSSVRVHTDEKAAESAQAVNALAYTVGRDIVFGTGQYVPRTNEGQRLLAHELTHVMQQSEACYMQAKLQIGQRKDIHEQEADRVAEQVTRLRSPANQYRKVAVSMLQQSHRNEKTAQEGNSADVVHVAGQTFERVIQRQLICHIDHIKTECGNADAQCKTVQSAYCAKQYPGSKEIEELHKNAVAGAESYKPEIPNATDNLLYFLAASGKEKVMPVELFKNHQATKDKLTDEHRAKFIEGAQKRLNDGRLKLGGSVAMDWTGTANAFHGTIEDLALAVGGYTLCSNVKVSAKDKGGGNVELIFDDWTVQAFDCYNWDPRKGIGALFGGVKDKDLCCLQNAGKGRHFQIRTDPWKNDYAPSLAKATISSTGSLPGSPSKSGGSKDENR